MPQKLWDNVVKKRLKAKKIKVAEESDVLDFIDSSWVLYTKVENKWLKKS